MTDLNDLIKDIRDEETIELYGILDAETQQRIEEKFMNGIGIETKLVKYKKAKRKRYAMLAVAAIIVLVMGLTSVAKNEWDVALVDFMGLSDANTLQLEGGEVQINQSSTFAGIKVMVVSSIGDKNSAYIRIETNYEFPENYNYETDYILPGNHSLIISDGEKHNAKDFASTFMYYAEDGKLCFLLSITNCEGLNKSRVQLKMKDLYLHHDLDNPQSKVEEEMLVEGTWELDWTYHYKSNAREYRMLKPFENSGVTYYLTKLEISPISIRIEAFCMPQDRNQTRPRDLVQKITYKDGTYIKISRDSSGGVRDGMFIDAFTDVEVMGETLRVDDVKSITISGIEFELK